MEKNYNLQVLRGIACIFVCLNHFTFFNKYGFGSAGVEVFLILSGYLTIFNYYKKGGNLSDHYLKRKFITILPMYWILTVLVYIVGLIIPSIFNTLDFSFKNLIYSLLLIPGKTPFIPPGWTLTYIFYFYIIVYLCNSCFKQIRLETKITIWIVLAIIVSFIIHNEFVISLNSPIMIEFVYGFILYRIKDLKFTSNNKIITSFISIMLVLIFFFSRITFIFSKHYIRL